MFSHHLSRVSHAAMLEEVELAYPIPGRALQTCGGTNPSHQGLQGESFQWKEKLPPRAYLLG